MTLKPVTTASIIEKALIDVGMTKSDLARALGMSPQSLYQKMRYDKFSYAELEKIAQALGGRIQVAFVFDEDQRQQPRPL